MSTGWLSSVRFVLLLVLSAVLEVGGDAGMRMGIEGRRAGFAIGALLLSAYGLVVNLPKWDFGRLLGVYIALFFVVSQAMAAIVFHERVRLSTLIGGALIVGGGLVLTFWQSR